MSKFSLLFVAVIFLFSCKLKPIITDKDVNRFNSNSDERTQYEYKEKLSAEERSYFAGKLSVNKELIINEKLYIFLKSWEETTYLEGGINKNGVDSPALMQELYKFVYKTKLPRTAVEMYADKRFNTIEKGQALEEGDLVFFKLKENEVVTNVGIYLKNNKFYSSSVSQGCAIFSLNKNVWKTHYVGATRLKK